MVDFNKEIFTLNDFIAYTGYARSYAYKLMHWRVIPITKPGGKKIFMLKSDIDAFLMKNRIASSSEIESKAATYVAFPSK